MNPAQTGANDPSASNIDELLPLSRRLDWRFLFPDPTLGLVAYLGPEDSPLLGALRRVADRVITSEGTQSELAVMVDPPAAVFERVLSSTRSFYVEFSRQSWPQRVQQVLVPWNYLRISRRAGFQAQAYWHYPDFESANRIIPVGEPGPIMFVIAKDKRDLKTRVKTSGMAVLVRFGLLARVVPHLSITGFKP